MIMFSPADPSIFAVGQQRGPYSMTFVAQRSKYYYSSFNLSSLIIIIISTSFTVASIRLEATRSLDALVLTVQELAFLVVNGVEPSSQSSIYQLNSSNR